MIEIITRNDKVVINSSHDLSTIMRRILKRKCTIDQNREHFWVVGLDNNNRILYIELISKGTAIKTYAVPQEVFCAAIHNRAIKIIVVHNHPSGNINPSDADVRVTQLLLQVGKLIGIPVLDHLIISDSDYFSFCDTGLMSKLRKNEELVPSFLIENKLKEKTLTMAKKLKQEGIDNEIISQTTGLHIREIKSIRVRRKRNANK